MDALRKGGQRMDSANQTLYNFADQEFNSKSATVENHVVF